MPMPRATTLLLAALLLPTPAAMATNFPITAAQRETAQRVQQAGVAIADLAPDAPQRYVVKAGDTLWAISTLYLTSPWRWPELWGFNRDQIENPHLIYPGQILLMVQRDGRAMLQLAGEAGSVADAAPGGRLSPRVRSSSLAENAVAAIPQHLIEPFLNEAVVLDSDEMASAPRVVAAPEGRVMMTLGDLVYARGTRTPLDGYRVFRQPKQLKDPSTGEVLGYEAFYLGAADLLRRGGEVQREGEQREIPFTLQLRHVRAEVGVGDRLAPVPQRSFKRYVPHGPERAIDGQIVSIYGEAIRAGQNQIVALNRGEADGLERGHVLALWRAGKPARDRTGEKIETVQLPDERHGVLFVFQTFKRVSYALIISVQDPVSVGDRFTQP